MADTMDMDIDMDIDLGASEAISALEAQAMKIEAPVTSAIDTIPITHKDIAAGAPTGDAAAVTPHKVHIRGVDSLSTADIKAFANEHFPGAEIERIEWIDDTSVNIVYNTPATALNALNAFSYIANEGPSSISTLQLRSAKSLSTHPDATLQVRLAVLGDRKQPGARDRSRYYLFNPDQDPGERRRREGRDGSRRGRRRFYEDDADGNYERRRYNDREHRRRQDGDEEAIFDGNMYDDDAAALAARGAQRDKHGDSYSSRSSSDAGNRDRRMVRFTDRGGRELFPERAHRGSRLRNRSASPVRDADGDQTMDVDGAGEVAAARKKHRERSYTPPRRVKNGIKELFPEKTAKKGLFPEKVGATKELFPEKSGKKELFPEKVNGIANTETLPSGPIELFPTKVRTTPSLHKRSAAFDAADETADLFAGRMVVPFTDGAGDNRSRSRNLAGRISRHPLGRGQPLEDRITTPGGDVNMATDVTTDEPTNFSIRGAAAASGRVQSLNQGFSIRGAATAPKELFPQKLAGGAKELFPEKLAGRGGQRRKAEDMF